MLWRSWRWNESPSTPCALMPSRRKMCAKLCITVVVPAPLEPVTAMMGCFIDTDSSRRRPGAFSYPRLRPIQRPFVEQRRDVRLVLAAVVIAVITLDARDFVLRAQYQRDTLVQRLRRGFHD